MWRVEDLLIFIFGISLIVLSYIYLVLRFFIGMPILVPILVITSAFTKFKYTNCWIFVIKKYLTKGGYIVFRRSMWSKYKGIVWEHAFWTPDLKTYYNVVPLDKKKKRILPPFLFESKLIIFEGGNLTPC